MGFFSVSYGYGLFKCCQWQIAENGGLFEFRYATVL